jgi:hypothetical protein
MPRHQSPQIAENGNTESPEIPPNRAASGKIDYFTSPLAARRTPSIGQRFLRPTISFREQLQADSPAARIAGLTKPYRPIALSPLALG